MSVRFFGAGTVTYEKIILEGATDLEAPSGEDITIKMGDAAGSNKVSFVDSADVEQVYIDSDGNINF